MCETLFEMRFVNYFTDYDLPTCLEEYGQYFFMYCFANGQDKILQTLGADMYTFIQNLDPLHVVLQMTYTDIIAPSFR